MNHSEFRQLVLQGLEQSLYKHLSIDEATAPLVVDDIKKIFDVHGDFCTRCGLKETECLC